LPPGEKTSARTAASTPKHKQRLNVFFGNGGKRGSAGGKCRWDAQPEKQGEKKGRLEDEKRPP